MGSEESICDLCLCEPGEVKDPITRKCVKYEECERACIFNGVAYQEGEEYWKSDCSKCTCEDGHEKCDYDVCRLSQDVCDQQGQRFVHVTGSCCFCAHIAVNVTTTTVKFTTTSSDATTPNNAVETTPNNAVETTPASTTMSTVGRQDTTVPAAPVTTVHEDFFTTRVSVETTVPVQEDTTTVVNEDTTSPVVSSTTSSAVVDTTVSDVVNTTSVPVTTTTEKLMTPITRERCLYNGMNYDRPAPNNQWSFNCTICKCVAGEATCHKACTIDSCPVGEKLVTDVPDDECCRCEHDEDKHHECKYEGEIYEAGNTWNDGNCTTCECDYDVGVNCTDERDHCDVTCDPMSQDLVYKDDECCPTCVDKPTIIRGCQPINATQQLETSEGCITEEEVELTACSGACGSSTNVLPYAPFLETNCHCCQPDQVEEMEVRTLCPDGEIKMLTIPVIRTCGCSRCEN